MSGIRKYAGLPDLDLAPDIYETPELTDDNSTIPTSTQDRPDSSLSADDPLGNGENGIDRQRIDQNDARTHFLSGHERDPRIFSRVSEKRESHQASRQRHRKAGEDIINEIAGSDSEDQESLDRRLARLRREVAEVKNEIESQKDQADYPSDPQTAAAMADAESISTILETIKSQVGGSDQSLTFRHLQRLGSTSITPEKAGKIRLGVFAPEDIQSSSLGADHDEEQRIAGIIDTDARLKLLEDALGIESLPLGTQSQASKKTLLPTLEFLDKQIRILSTSSETSMSQVESRMKELSREAVALEQNRIQARKALEAVSPSDPKHRSLIANPSDADNYEMKDSEQAFKINALFGTIDTIESLAPILPSVLDRLRSLQDLHTNAATASQILSSIEKRQDDVRDEIQTWKEGLERVEQAVVQSHETSKENTDLIERWVKEIEQRMTKSG
ncbi:uncharacterized protein KY384_008432 [Bacidia gigantensis]|uniref:uncharacterized protein n=1 Tax=Bacidia gigantensis TaxID=2732470 RepID=UPI001D05BCBD|nr:uncharacterized protein KY384_008432 [Bacidia gigantensis]KAG8527003.1 hypothetical protein KY384_008432 [Bacidia gigantensis]